MIHNILYEKAAGLFGKLKNARIIESNVSLELELRSIRCREDVSKDELYLFQPDCITATVHYS